MDLACDVCPQVTVAAWINVEPLPDQMFFGASHGPRMMASQAQMGLRSGGTDVWAYDAVFANGGWMYVAGVWDAETGRSSFHRRGRGVDGQVGTVRAGIPPAVYLRGAE